jgi:imidazolonepropionase-like amidohydrolase
VIRGGRIASVAAGPANAAGIQTVDGRGMTAMADIVLVNGNPLEGYWNMLNAKVVIKGGVIVSDKR